MAYKLIKVGTQANSQAREYVADSVNDIATLPDSDPFGSTVFVIETSETYMKTSEGNYVKVNSGGGGGGGGSTEPLVVNMTSGESEHGETTVTLDVTAAELFEAYEEGRCAVYHSVFKLEDEEEVLVPVDAIVMVQFNRIHLGDECIYSFVQWDPEDGTMLFGEDIAGTDYVVLTTKETSKSGNAPLETNCTVTADGETGKQVLTTDLTAEDLFSAIEAGKFVALNIVIDEDVIRKIIVVDAQDFNGQFYDFSFITISGDDGVIGFFAGELSADDTVVFREF